MPTSASLVTNLPADFNTFGQAVDTSMSELLGGTTGQVLSKTSATNMDFTWVTPTDQTPLTTKGDLFAFTTVDARLAVGSNYGFLQADSTQATGLLWNNAAWTSYTPTLTSQTGSITTATASGYYTRIGKLCAVYVRANITTAGTGAGFLGISMPFTSANTNEQIFVGRETIATGTAMTGNLAPSDTVLKVLTYNALTPIASGTRVIASGIFEVA